MAGWAPIPGETPIDDVSGLRIKGIGTREELNAAEAKNVNEALLKYFASKPARALAPFDLTWTIELHREMFGDVWDWAGVIRTRDGFNLGIPFHNIQSELFNLLQDLESWPGFQMDFVEQAARLHHRAVKIHPFVNGNGRWARMLANIWLNLHDRPIVVWPENAIGDESPIRQDYLAAIRSADDEEYQPLIELHRLYQESPDQA